ncbi:MAG: cyclic-di-AMP receptor [Chloroflexia bacterium]
MKLALAVIQKAHTDLVLDALTEAGYRATRLASTGGFLREGNTTLIVGTEDAQIDPLIRLLRETVAHATGRPPASSGESTGRGAVFVLPLTESFQL